MSQRQMTSTKSEPNFLEVAEFLRGCSLFATLADGELERIASLCQPSSYRPQQVVFHQGEPSESLYIVVEGTVAMVRHADSRRSELSLTIAILGKGEAFGLSSQVKPYVHHSSAVCQSSATLLVIDGARLRLLLEQNHHIGYEVLSNLVSMFCSRLKALHQAVEAKL